MALSIPGCVMKVVEISSIEEGERFRKDYGDLAELCHSIKAHGLINPIAVTPNPEGGYTLVAGGRRLAALKENQEELVPVRIFQKIDEMQLRIIELAENLQRKEMTWKESNSLQREIHRLQQSLHGKAINGPANTGWRVEDTASMLGVSPAKVSEAISMANKVERYGTILDFDSCKNENEARKLMRQVEEAAARQELSRRASAKTGTSFTKTIIDSYIIGDFLEHGPKHAPESFDFAEVDPPYGMDLPENKLNNDCAGYHEIDKDQYLIFTASVMQAVYNALKPDTFAIYWFAGEPWIDHLYRIALKTGFDTTRNPLIWPKPTGQSKNPNTHLARAYEMAFVLRKGFPMLAKPGHSDVFTFDPVPHQRKHHPTQKPIELYKEIYQTFSFENSKCLVPFAGSGASLLAAWTTKRQAIGYDLTEEFRGGFIEMVNHYCVMD